jgi:hypothetical protein
MIKYFEDFLNELLIKVAKYFISGLMNMSNFVNLVYL